ncbi:MAG: hypothetical protein WC521_03435 [Bdellovibrionales bacterium]|jgi:hypothetical protein
MDAIAEGMIRATEWETLYDGAHGVNLGALGMMSCWRRSAAELFGEDHKITQYYVSIKKTLRELGENIGGDDIEAMKRAIVPADQLALELNKIYGDITREEDITREDHIKRYKPDEYRHT